MRYITLSLALSLLAWVPARAEDQPRSASAEVKVGTSVANHEIVGEAASFTITPETKLYTWVKVTGMADQTVTVTYLKDGNEVSKVELNVPRSPFRTHAYKTFRKGDEGSWTASARASDGTELGKAEFTVAIGQ